MAAVKILALAFAASVFVEAKWYQHHKRDVISNICDPSNTNTTLQCYCTTDNHSPKVIRSASCHLVSKTVLPDDESWEAFDALKSIHKVVFSNTRGVSITYVPTKALMHLETVSKVEIKYGNIERIDAFAFANLTLVEEIILSDNQIKSLAVNAFSHHRDLSSIGLDTNNIVEINRDIFVDLPSLEKIYLTNNKITTIHDKAFIHLINLRELEIDRNKLFSLNSETFSGLKELQKLDLSSNNLEVIGDNTFLPLKNLRTLNLDGNKIQMLDEKAFNGLFKLNVLSLAHNNLTNIENVKIFEGLKDLTVLSFKSNQLVELKPALMAPILNNFYGNNSLLDVEDNNFPCDCRLEWLMTLMNKTQNNHLKIATENLKCNPDIELKEQWINMAETEKSGMQIFEEEDQQVPNADYEYYDEAQLNGKLFYIDVRDLINCTSNERSLDTKDSQTTVKTDTAKTTTKVISSPLTTPKPLSTTQYLLVSTSKATTNGLEGTTGLARTNKSIKPDNLGNGSAKDSYTTMRLATVSAKSESNVYQEMTTEEIIAEKVAKLQRSIQEESSMHTNDAHRNFNGAVVLFSVILCFRLHF